MFMWVIVIVLMGPATPTPTTPVLFLLGPKAHYILLVPPMARPVNGVDALRRVQK